MLLIINFRSNQNTQRVRDSRQRSLDSKIVNQHDRKNKKINKETKEQLVSIFLKVPTNVYFKWMKVRIPVFIIKSVFVQLGPKLKSSAQVLAQSGTLKCLSKPPPTTNTTHHHHPPHLTFRHVIG